MRQAASRRARRQSAYFLGHNPLSDSPAAFGSPAGPPRAWRRGASRQLSDRPADAAPIGWFFVRVVDIKERSDRIFAGTNASVAQFPRLLVYPEKARHPCEIVNSEASRTHANRPVWLCGNSTYSRDFLARGVKLPEPRIGDLVAFHHAGAYCRSMLARFLGKGIPSEVALNCSMNGTALLSAAE
jgi:diaminopimelate decarboxylase